MQNFNKFNDSDYISDAPDKLNDNFQTIASDFAGTSFPATDLVEGMTCYRTDEQVLYRYNGGSWKVEYGFVDGGISVKQANDLPASKYATQAEAEGGVDNTKVMTPLRTQNAIDKKRPLKTYTTLESVGVGNSATIDKLASTMPVNSMLVTSLQKSSVPNMTLPLDGTLIATKRDGSRIIFQLVCPDGNYTKYYFGGYAEWTNPKFSGWKQIVTNGALSMPSTTKITVSPILTESATGSGYVNFVSYVAPCDGWIRCGMRPKGTRAYIRTQLDTQTIQTNLIVDIGVGGVILQPVAKGQTVVVSAYGGAEIVECYFYYAQSEV